MPRNQRWRSASLPTVRKLLSCGRAFPGSPHFTRKALGAYPTLSLAQAREKARKWLHLVAEGIDPEIEAERARWNELRKQKHTFAFVAEQFIKEAVIGPNPQKPLQRQAARLPITFAMY